MNLHQGFVDVISSIGSLKWPCVALLASKVVSHRLLHQQLIKDGGPENEKHGQVEDNKTPEGENS